MQILNNPTSAFSSYKLIVGGDSYSIKQRYNTRTESWYMDVYTSSGTPIVLGRKLQVNMPVVNTNITMMPEGNLMVIQNVGSTALKIDRNNLSNVGDFSIIYYTLEDLS